MVHHGVQMTTSTRTRRWDFLLSCLGSWGTGWRWLRVWVYNHGHPGLIRALCATLPKRKCTLCTIPAAWMGSRGRRGHSKSTKMRVRVAKSIWTYWTMPCGMAWSLVPNGCKESYGVVESCSVATPPFRLWRLVTGWSRHQLYRTSIDCSPCKRPALSLSGGLTTTAEASLINRCIDARCSVSHCTRLLLTQSYTTACTHCILAPL